MEQQDGNIQLHLAEKDLTIAEKNKKHINPVEKGHIAFRTDDIEEFKTIHALKEPEETKENFKEGKVIKLNFKTKTRGEA